MDKHGQTPLHMAADGEKDSPKLCEIVMNHDAKVDAVDDGGNQPIHLACKRFHTETGIVLLSHGPNVTSRYQNKERTFAADFTQTLALQATATIEGTGKANESLLTCLLYWAVYNGNRMDMWLLLKLGANPNGLANGHSISLTPLHVAVSRKEDSPELSQLLIECGSDTNALDESGNQALHMASSLGHTETVKCLAAHTKTSINGVNTLGLTPLLSAVTAKTVHPELCEALLQHNASTVVMDADDNQPLHVACRRYLSEIVDILLSYGASSNAANKHGQTPLHTAVNNEKASLGVCKILLKHDANVNAVDEDGNQPLHLACKQGHVETGILLQYHGADRNAVNRNDFIPLSLISQCIFRAAIKTDKQGNSALHIAARKSLTRTVQLLADCGADPNAVNDNEQTPLHTGAGGWKDCPELCEILLKHDASINAVDKDGNQAFHFACRQNHTKTAVTLLSHGPNVTTTILADRTRTFTTDFTQSVALQAIRHVQCTASSDKLLLSSLLYWAIHSGAEGDVKMLLEQGANANGLANGTSVFLTPLHVAADRKEDCPILGQLLLKHGSQIEAVDEFGQQALHLTCYHGHMKTGIMLIHHEADTNALSKHGQTPLHRAAGGEIDCPELCEILLKGDAKIDAVDEDGNQPFHLACKQGHTETGIALLNYGPNITFRYQNKERTFEADFTQALALQATRAIEDAGNADQLILTCLLYWAVYSGRQEDMRLLLKLGANPNGLANNDSIYLTPLHVAVNRKNDSPELSQLLIDYGSDVNAADESGNQALHIASSLSHTQTVNCLVADVNININGVNGLGLTPLLSAVQAKTVHPKICGTLLQHKAITDAVDEDENQPLHVACRRDCEEIVNILLLHGASSNAGNKHGQTPMHVAANSKKDSPGLCEILLQHDADINAEDEDGNQPLHLVCKLDHCKTGNLLVLKGAETNEPNKQGETALHIVAGQDSKKMCKILLKHGAQLAAADKDGKQPLHIACERGSVAVGKLLLSEGADVLALDLHENKPH